MKLIGKLTDALALRIFKLIKADAHLRRSLTGYTGAQGMVGQPADALFYQWREAQNKPNGTLEEFFEWFHSAVKNPTKINDYDNHPQT